ncbi:MAG TPA: ankyrin repeat domain-containing protein, partial [Beijerinckiaceae bacterium]|nr:ankyrin repeat domain-containing protein [Beijerinckiaceae bacterium]
IRAILDTNRLCLYENVARINSRNWVYVADLASQTLLDGRMPASEYAEKIIGKGLLSYPESVPVQPGAVMRRHPVAGASPLTFLVVQDPEANEALPEVCMWVVKERATDILDLRDNNGDTALVVAVQEDHPACVDALLDAGAGVDAPDALGRTPLMRAVWAANQRMVHKLLDKNANPTAFHNGASAISLAAMNRSADNAETMDEIIFELLLSAPEHLDKLLAEGAPYERAMAVADGLCTWLTLAHSENKTIREAAMEQLKVLPAKAPDACTTLFSIDQERGLKTFLRMLELMSDLPCAEGDDLALALEPIYASMWDQAIGAASLPNLMSLLKEARKGATSDGADKHFSAHPGSADVARRILTRMPELVSTTPDHGDFETSLSYLRVYEEMDEFHRENVDDRQFELQIYRCLKDLADGAGRAVAYMEMFRLLAFVPPEQKSAFVDELNRRGVNSRDMAAVGAFWAEFTRAPDLEFPWNK